MKAAPSKNAAMSLMPTRSRITPKTPIKKNHIKLGGTVSVRMAVMLATG